MKFLQIVAVVCLGAVLTLSAVEYKKTSQKSAQEKPLFDETPMEILFSSQITKEVEDRATEIRALIRSDDNYKEASELLYDKSKHLDTKSFVDPEYKYGKEQPGIGIPNYPEIVIVLEKSVKATSNPISAFIGIYIIQTYLGGDNPQNKKLLNFFSDTLYEYKTCEGYLTKGELTYRGTEGKRGDRAMALEIYEEGYKQCRGVGYYANSIGGRIDYIKFKDTLK